MNAQKIAALKKKGIAMLNFADHNVVVSNTLPFWVRADNTLYLSVGVKVLRSKEGNIYLKPEGDSIIHAGRAYAQIQDFPEDTVIDVLCKKMEPNPDVTEEMLASVEAKYPGSTKAYKFALENDKCQFHFAEEFLDD